MKKHLITAAVMPLLAISLAGCSASGITQVAQMADKARKVQKTAATVEGVTGADMDVVTDPLGMKKRAAAADAAAMAEGQAALANAEPISAAPMAIEMRKTSGSTKVLSSRPKMAIVGYNVAARVEGQANSTARGGFMSNNLGASVSTKLISSGIDGALVQRVADAAAEDLVAQLTAAGFDVIDPYGVSMAESNVVMKAGGGPVEGKGAIMAGPTTYGYRKVNSGLGMGNAGNKPVKLVEELDAVLVQPTIILDFAKLKGGRNFGNKASTSASLQFSLAPESSIAVHSGDRRGLRWLAYGTKKGAQSDAVFAVMGEKETSTNALEQGLGSALGMATRNKKRTTQAVIIDPVRYEALALSAAKGWNAAFVAQAQAARAKNS